MAWLVQDVQQVPSTHTIPAPQSALMVQDPVGISRQKPPWQTAPLGQGRSGPQAVVHRSFTHTRPGPHSDEKRQTSLGRRHSPLSSTQIRPSGQGIEGPQRGSTRATQVPSTHARSSPGRSKRSQSAELRQVQAIEPPGPVSVGCTQ
jgi:hypothetical protein